MKNLSIKVITTFLILLAISANVNAQEKLKLDIEDIEISIQLPATEMVLPKDKTYAVKFIDRLNQYTQYKDNDSLGGRYASFNFKFDILAKQAKEGDNADYIFEVEGTQLEIYQVSEPKLITSTYIKNREIVSEKGYVVDMFCRFPIKVTVKNNANEIIKTIVMSDSEYEFPIRYHADFFGNTGGNYNDFIFDRTVPFASEDELTTSFYKEQRSGVLNKRIEKNILGIVVNELKLAAKLMFGEKAIKEKIEFPLQVIGNKKSENYADSQKAFEIIKNTFASPYTEKNIEEVAGKLAETVEIYKKVWSNDKDSEKYRETNLLLCDIFSKKFEDASSNYIRMSFVRNKVDTYLLNYNAPMGNKMIDNLDMIIAYLSLYNIKDAKYIPCLIKDANYTAKYQYDAGIIEEQKRIERLKKAGLPIE